MTAPATPSEVAETYQRQAGELAAATAVAALALYATLRADGAPVGTVAEAVAAVVATANAAATALADLGVAAQVEAATGRPSPPTGIAPRDDAPRLTAAVRTILDDADGEAPDAETPAPPDDAPAPPDETIEAGAEHGEGPAVPDATDQGTEDTAVPRLERLARAEPLETGHAVTVELIGGNPVVLGWRRVLDTDPCERCQRWAEDGRTFRPDATFKRHLGCNCQQQLITEEAGTR